MVFTAVNPIPMQHPLLTGKGIATQNPKFDLKPENYGVEHYMAIVEAFLRYRRPIVDRWLFNERLYESELYSGLGYEGTLPVSRGYSVVQTLASMLYARNPKLFVNNLVSGEEELSHLWELLINNEWALPGFLDRETVNSILDCAIYGRARVMTTYEADFESVTRAMNQRIEQVDDATLQGSIEEWRDLRMDEIATVLHQPEYKSTWEHDFRISEQRVASRHENVWDILEDDQAAISHQMDWEGRRIELPIEDVQEGPFDSKFISAVTENSGHPLQFWPNEKIRGRTKYDHGTQDFRTWVTLYEIWHYRAGRLVTVAPGVATFGRNIPIPYHVRPFQHLSWNARGDGMFPRSDLGVVSNQIAEEEVMRSKLRDAFQREAIDVYLVDERFGIGEEQIVPWTSPEGSVFIPVRAREGVPIQQSLAPLPRQQKSPDIMNYLSLLRQDVQETLGISANMSGLALKSETSATEAGEIAGFARTKAGYKFRAVEAFVSEIAFARMGLYAQFYTEEQILHLAGPIAAREWAGHAFTKGDVLSRFQVTVEQGSMSDTSDLSRQLTFERLFQMAFTIPGAADLINLRELFVRWMDSQGIKDGDAILNLTDPRQMAQVIANAQAERGASGSSGSGAGGQVPTEAGASQANLGALLGAA